MKTKTVSPKRPWLVSAICIIGFFSLLFSLAGTNGDYLLSCSYSAFIAVVTLGCLIGFWKMKKVSLYIFFSTFLVNQLVTVYIGHWSVTTLLLPLAIIGITLFYHHKMN